MPEITASARVGSFTLPEKKDQRPNLVSLLSGHLENWGDSTMADSSPRTDTSTDVDTDEKNQGVNFFFLLILVPNNINI